MNEYKWDCFNTIDFTLLKMKDKEIITIYRNEHGLLVVIYRDREQSSTTITIDQAKTLYHSAFSSGRIAISNEKEEMEKYFSETLNIEI